MSTPRDSVTAIAPASIGNIGVGFDILGQSFTALHDHVTARRIPGKGVRLGTVEGLVTKLPEDPRRNTALRGALALLEDAGADFAAEISVHKGVPLSAGLGGSAASAVAGVVAANGLLPNPYSTAQLFEFALEGETASSDPPPPDNVAAALFGGIVLIRPGASPELVEIPPPTGLVCCAAHPDAELDTRLSRSILSRSVPLARVVEHSRDLASFIIGCCQDNIGLVADGLRDVLIEPQRAGLVHGFTEAKAAALAAGALGCSLSGSGPTVFAWARSEHGQAVAEALKSGFASMGVGSRIYVAPLSGAGAEIVS
jgi:homoserine kinase